MDYIASEMISKQLDGKSPSEVSKLRLSTHPAIRAASSFAFSSVSSNTTSFGFQANPGQQREQLCYKDNTGTLSLTTHLKRKIVRDNIFGVDVDYRAVEVTMLSLYLKILEGETRTTMGMQQTFFPSETFLPDLSSNIQCGNSLVGSDFFDDTLLGQMHTDDRGMNAFDWKEAFLTSSGRAVSTPLWGIRRISGFSF